MKLVRKTYTALVVDDERKIARLIQAFLKLSDYFDNVVIAHSVLEAQQKLQNQEFDLLITDLVMPGKDGLSLIDQVKRNPKLRKTKIILISGYLKQENVLKAVNKGVNKIIVKPFKRLQVVNAAHDVLGLVKNNKAINANELDDGVMEQVLEEEDKNKFGYE